MSREDGFRPPGRSEGGASIRPDDLVGLLGGHLGGSLGLDLAEPEDEALGHWLLAAALAGGRQTEAVVLAACEALRDEGLFSPNALAGADPGRVESLLTRAELAKPAAAAQLLVRLSAALVERYDGSLSRLAGDADGLDELAGRLARLAPGFGRAGVVRYLTPLRGVWHAANDLPATAAVHAAALDLGFAPETQDAEGTPALLARRFAEYETTDDDSPASHAPTGAASAVALLDFEAALEKIGRASCLRGRVDRCPLGEACPRRAPAPTGKR